MRVISTLAAVLCGFVLQTAAFAQESASASAAAQASVPPAPAVPAAPTGPRVALKTTMGEIVIELEQEKAPITTDNFLKYVKSGFYNGLIFHRVIDGFMIQTGGYDKNLKPKQTRKAIKNEAGNGLSNAPYTVAMAREAGADTATSQFFINVGDNAGLDRVNRNDAGYTVFGHVVEGKEVVDKIAKTVVDDKNATFQNVPVTPIVITSAKVK
ncbi:MAG: peptidylprolyl isomerase [Telluria sp.]